MSTLPTIPLMDAREKGPVRHVLAAPARARARALRDDCLAWLPAGARAPLRRRTERPWLRPYDIAANLAGTWRLCAYPPDHLLREVFESCADYAEARRRLETTPLARPVIFTLVGCQAGERCVIERTEED